MMLQSNSQRLFAASLCISILFAGVGCAVQHTDRLGPMQAPSTSAQAANILVADKSAFSNVRVYQDPDGQIWIPLEETAKSLDFDLHFINDSFTLGQTDAAYSVKVNETQAFAGGQTVELPQAPKFFDQKPYMTAQALTALMHTPVIWNVQNAEVVITPIDDSQLSAVTSQASAGQTIHSLAVESKGELLRLAHSLVGTPYQFAAGPYESTRAFDCSSFVQYVYDKVGVRLPRSSRDQAEVGQQVTADQLQPGDLMFFYTPGRFANNRTVGHVGIYSGNGQLIHTFGQPGVTKSDFNSYWKDRFLFGKRVS